jgi:hypothetical protein
MRETGRHHFGSSHLRLLPGYSVETFGLFAIRRIERDADDQYYERE